MLMKNKTLLQEVLMYHAIPDAKVMSSDIQNEELVASGDPMGDNIRFNIYTVNGGQNILTADGARIIKADHMASNGVIHVVDKVMFPVATMNIAEYVMKEQSYFSTLLDAAKDAGLQDVLAGPGPFTLFAPDDAAFKKIPKATLDALLKDKTKLMQVLEYHVLGQTLYTHGMQDMGYMTEQGKNIMIKRVGEKHHMSMIKLNGNVTLKYADFSCTNGVFHVVDTVLMPPM